MAAQDITLIGAVFSRLTVLSEPFRHGRINRWHVNCRCECGTETLSQCILLVSGHTKSCGCLQKDTVRELSQPKRRLLLGERFDRLTVTSNEYRLAKNGKWGVRCACDCGSEIEVICHSLVSGNTKSCGCRKREATAKVNRTHGRSSDSIYSIYIQMVKRCTKVGSHSYEYYGGRGIKVCDRWLESFENFLADMGERPEGKTLDRYPDQNGNYEPSNCRWATSSEQSNNKRNNHILVVDGVSKTLSEWSLSTGISARTLWNRTRYDWSNNDIVNRPTRRPRQK